MVGCLDDEVEVEKHKVGSLVEVDKEGSLVVVDNQQVGSQMAEDTYVGSHGQVDDVGAGAVEGNHRTVVRTGGHGADMADRSLTFPGSVEHPLDGSQISHLVCLIQPCVVSAKLIIIYINFLPSIHSNHN